MIHYYFLLAWRKLFRQKGYTALNITGLSLGMTAAIFLMQYVAFERGYNRQAPNCRNLYRILVQEGQAREWETLLPTALAPELEKSFPEIKTAAAMADDLGDGVLSRQANGAGVTDKTFRENRAVYGDAAYWKILQPTLLHGAVQLERANTLLLSESYARKYFDGEDPVGKPLFLYNQFGNQSFTVTGVYQDLSPQTDYPAPFICSMETFRAPASLNGNDWAALDHWGGGLHLVFVELKPGVAPAGLEQKIAALLREQHREAEVRVSLQPLAEVHLGKRLAETLPVFGNRGIVLSLFAIALLILLIAWVNYVNLTVVQGFRQLKEIGVRKTVGALRGQLAGQYLVESLLVNGASLLLALALVQTLQPLFNAMTGKPLGLAILVSSGFWSIIAGMLLTGVLASGGYVAKVLTGFSPLETLKSSFHRPLGSTLLREGLIVGQFSIAIVLIVAAIVLQRQLDFMKNKNLGMDLSQVLVVRGPEVQYEDQAARQTAFLNQVEALPWVRDYCATGALPGATFNQNFNADGFVAPHSLPEHAKVSFTVLIVDDRFVPTYKLQLAGGQNFSRDVVLQGRKSRKMLLNEQGARALGYDNPAEISGEWVKWNEEQYQVVGVLKDYHHQGLRTAIRPMVFFPSVNSGLVSIRTGTDGLPDKLKQLKGLFGAGFPNDPFEYYFADQDFASQYAEENKLGSLSLAASGMAIFIACLGLLGLAAYTAERRTKEIGIRKVLGASVVSVVRLLTQDFVQLIAIALLIAAPAAWYGMQQWLGGFAYHIDIQWWYFVLAGLLAVTVALLTVGVQTLRAAMVNPARSLKSE